MLKGEIGGWLRSARHAVPHNRAFTDRFGESRPTGLGRKFPFARSGSCRSNRFTAERQVTNVLLTERHGGRMAVQADYAKASIMESSLR
jgi:hypothetical protein